MRPVYDIVYGDHKYPNGEVGLISFNICSLVWHCLQGWKKLVLIGSKRLLWLVLFAKFRLSVVKKKPDDDLLLFFSSYINSNSTKALSR